MIFVKIHFKKSAPMTFAPVSRLLWPVMRIILLATVLTGVWLRFEGIGRKPVWYDEVATFLHLSGKTEAQLGRLYDGRVLHVGELLQEYQGGARSEGAIISEASFGSIPDVVRAVATDEPQSGALYFTVAAAVVAGTDDPARVRLLSAVASSVSLLLLGLLAWRLFDQKIALAAVALAAISPLELRFAQEARPYAMCVALLLASALAANRASHTRHLPSWLLYALCLTAALWTHPIALLAVPGLLALAIKPKPNREPLLRRGALHTGWLATAAAVTAWLPWALVCSSAYPKIQRLTSWSSEPIGVVGLARGWLGAITSLFFRPRGEGGIFPSDFSVPAISVVSILLAGAVVAIAAAALVSITRHPDRSTRRYVLLLALVPWLAFAALDITLGGRRSTVPRYLIPAWAGLELAVAYWMMRSDSWPRARHLLLMLLLALGAATAWRTQAARGWWDTDVPRLLALRETAAVIDAIPGAIVVTDTPPLNLLELARYLHPETSFRLGPTAATSLADEEWSRAVLIAPSQSLFDAMSKSATERGTRLEKWRSDGVGPALWRVVAFAPEVGSRWQFERQHLATQLEFDLRRSRLYARTDHFRFDPDKRPGHLHVAAMSMLPEE
ncbi:hypothetical protein ELE36_04500 [Pseudolysobacter antarcticus]|uniref:Glycosyltransferase RgtA/B/C/D-like domain-containing protein n=1 Tax=Pseudolysobacter antarcticus TaxID=2511995 RepID=A0A411HGU1_9GAMM|nr:glycosyltransferase family 39 protein [Pseudolysobacter antarcticus]QBB69691.1 hypothetical protein ELE36_04500 [Pseudolysobacter antarcticus]